MLYTEEKELIVAIDDDPGILNSVMSILKGGYTVRAFTSGEEALRFLARNGADMVLVDYLMPAPSGPDVLARLQLDERTAKIPVIFLTGSDNAATEAEVLEKGAMDYIHKPVNAPTLLARVRLQLELKGYRHHLEQMVEAKVKDIMDACAKLELREQMTLGLLARATDLRDHDTGGHIERTTAFTRMLVEDLRLNKEPGYHLSETEAEEIILSVKLHDLGKIALPDSILKKPAPLTREEFEIVKLHPKHGADLLDEFIGTMGDGDLFLATARDIVLYHHEKWDGSGYPQGLAGDSIPLSARITTFADVYDALRSARPYKEGLKHEEALRIIVEGSGKQFDPYLTSVFVRLSDRVEAIASSL
ncbi:MAG: response regulator [Deltaproteobacteria bacterium]|jgi:putative two-component system response regulator|nr:response regulator [Deltaproteobacteria bacterium]